MVSKEEEIFAFFVCISLESSLASEALELGNEEGTNS